MDETYQIIELLESKKNVLLLGAPGTGKSKLMNEVAEVFELGGSKLNQPTRIPGAAIPVPAKASPNGLNCSILNYGNRKVFRTTMHQNSKYRDFLTGIVPVIGTESGYKINEGILFRANEYAKQPDSAALLIIDELNRGPAIEVFGGSIVAIEADKRLDENNQPDNNTQFFEIENPADGNLIEYAFSPRLYILAAMNQADVSVAPLDVAFLRRWQQYMLVPDYSSLYDAFGIIKPNVVPEECNTAADVYSVAFMALEEINYLISIGRGEEYQLGQGVFLSTRPNGDSKEDALEFVLEAWSTIYSHINELFFGDSASIAYILNASSTKSPYNLEEKSFNRETKYILTHDDIDNENIFKLYQAIAEHD